jgi:hypothetical protein
MSASGAWWNDVPLEERGRNVDTDTTLGLDPWRPLHQHCYSLNVQTPKTDAEMQRIGELWNGRRDVELGLWGHATQDFECLRHFPGLERLNVQCPIIRNIEGLRHVADTLQKFDFANTTVRHSMRAVASCTQLESLHLQRHNRDFNALHALKQLRYLGLSGISLPDLTPLLPFENTLESLFLGFCKPLDLGLLGRFGNLQSLHFLKINNLPDVSALRLARNLKRIELEWLPHVETLPDFSELTQLEELEISSMKSLRDIASIAKAPALRFLGLWDCKGLRPENFECLIRHPTLKRLNYGIGRLKDNNTVEAMFPQEMTQSVRYRITPGTWLRRPTP